MVNFSNHPFQSSVDGALLRAYPCEDDVSFTSEAPSEHLPQYTPINSRPDSHSAIVPPSYSTLHIGHDFDALLLTASITSTAIRANTEATATTQRTQPSEIEAYPLDLQPTLDPDSKEVRAHLGLFPEPVLLSTPVRPAIVSRPYDKKTSEIVTEKGKGKKDDPTPDDDDGSAIPLRRRPLSLDLSQDDASLSLGSRLGAPSDFSPTESFPGSQTKFVKHIFQLKDPKDLPWITLIMESRAHTPDSIPVFHGGDIIQGHMYLTANSSDTSIQAITLTILGKLVTSSYQEGEYTFLDNTVTIWSRASSSAKSVSDAVMVGSKLSGGHSWPIYLPFPDTIALERRKKLPAQIVNAPQSFLEKAVSASVRYELALKVCKERFRSDSKLQTMIHYVPTLRPDSPSPLMQLGYAQNTPLPGPKVDLTGWFTLNPVTVQGTFGNRQGAVEYTLSLANPLCYTRGSVIPLSLMVRSQDSEVLDALSSPNVMSIVLKRRIQYYEDAATYYKYCDPPPEKRRTEVQRISDAKWWIPSKDGLHAITERRLEGELHLDDTLQPSCDFPLFAIQYLVAFLPPACGIFPSVSSKSLATQRVRIGTAYPVGCPLPTSFTNSGPRLRSSYAEKTKSIGSLTSLDANRNKWGDYAGSTFSIPCTYQVGSVSTASTARSRGSSKKSRSIGPESVIESDEDFEEGGF